MIGQPKWTMAAEKSPASPRKGLRAPDWMHSEEPPCRHGQGYIAQGAVLPVFADAKKNSELIALILDDPRKLKRLSRDCGVELIAG